MRIQQVWIQALELIKVRLIFSTESGEKRIFDFHVFLSFFRNYSGILHIHLAVLDIWYIFSQIFQKS